MEALIEIRSQLDQLLLQLGTDREALEAREREVAEAAEQLSQEASVRAAWQQGAAAERSRVAALIEHQLEYLRAGGLGATVLQALRRQVLEVDG
jgi:hypothetical protein